LIPAQFRGLSSRLRNSGFQPSPATDYHLHPHYREQTPLDAVLLRTQAGSDNFINERYHDGIAELFGDWSASLLRAAQETDAIERSLAANFSATSAKPAESRLLRSDPHLQVHRNLFAREASLGRGAFLQEWRSSMASFSKIITANFQITSIESTSLPPSTAPSILKTRVLYELVGSGHDFWREQRVGEWELEWALPSGAAGQFRLHSWRTLEETCSRSASPMFSDITAQALVGNNSYSHQLLHGADYWRTVLDGACGIDIYGHNGVSVADIDNDGFDDLYICQPAGLPNRLFRNQGDGTFADITEASGLGILDNTACALFADFDNDGRQDVIVVRTNGPLLFLNQGDGKFRQKPDAFHFSQPPQGTFTGAAVADYDRDGWLDIYFCLYLYYQGTGQYRYPSPYYDAENGPPNFLMRNNRDNTFRDVTAQTGLDKNNTRYSFCCGWNDYNRDGWPDLYVVNDFGRKNLYRNNGDGTFSDVAAQAGVEDVGAGMSVSWFDYDNNGVEDLYVADMWTAAGVRISTQDVFQKNAPAAVRTLYRKHAMGNSLFRNNSDGTFRDDSASAAVRLGRWSWSSDVWDFDHDGYPDLYIADGMVSGPSRQDLNSFFWRQVVANSPSDARPAHDYEQAWNALNELIRSDHTWSGFERNVFYANNRDGTFSDVSGAVDLDFLEDARAFALSDFDHDGRQEVFLKNRNAPQLRIVKNVIKDLPPAIAFRLRGARSNRDAIGAVVTVETNSGRQTRTLHAGSGFLSQHSKELFFGLGEASDVVRASIRWPNGLVQNLDSVPSNHRIWVEEGSSNLRVESFKLFDPKNKLFAAQAVPETESLPENVEVWLIAPVAAPDFSAPDLAGKVWTLSTLRKRRVLLNMWTKDASGVREHLMDLNAAYAPWAQQGLQLLAVNLDDSAASQAADDLARSLDLAFPVLRGSEDLAGIYNLLYRYMFDRHRDLSLPTSFLIDEAGKIVKVYQGRTSPKQVDQDLLQIPKNAAERLARALPFPGVTDASEFRRNHLSLGSVFFQRGYYDPAEQSFQLALHDDPVSAEAMYGLGSVYLKQQRTNLARDNFERATRSHASYPETLPNAWNNLGLLATREGRMQAAIPYFQQALKLSPDHLIALENLGNAYRQLRQWDEAQSTLERAVAVGPEDAEANYSLGMVYAQVNDTKRAYEYLRRALTFRADYPEALNNLGVLYLRTNRRDEAVASFEQCIRVAPSFDQSYLNLARLHALEGDPDKARTVLLELLKQHPGHPQAQKALDQLSQ
jgi:tetratricopeptide (TPR) repeat protein